MQPESPKRGKIILLIILLVNTALLIAVYFTLPPLIHFSWLPAIYAGVGGALALWFVVYNRGFTRRNVTPDQLPADMTDEEKSAWIADGKERLNRSRWALTLIVPILLTFLCDMIYLFIGQRFLEMFGWK